MSEIPCDLQIRLLQLKREERLIDSELARIEADRIKLQIAELRVQQRLDRAVTLKTYLEAES